MQHTEIASRTCHTLNAVGKICRGCSDSLSCERIQYIKGRREEAALEKGPLL